MAYRVQLIRNATDLAASAEAWQRLVRACPTATVFATYPWNSVWWQHFGAAARLYLPAVYDGAGELVGLAPLLLRRTGLIRKLELIGTGLSDVGDFVLHPDHAAPAAAAVFAYLQAHCHEWDLVDLDEVPAYSFLAGDLAAVLPGGLQTMRLPRTDNPFIAAPAAWAAYRANVPRKWRSAFERPRFAADLTATFHLVTTPGTAAAAVHTLYRLHRARWAARPDALEAVHLTPPFAAFLAEVSTQLAAQGGLRLTELRVDDQVIGAGLNFVVNGHWNAYMQGFDPQWIAESPGQLLNTFAVKQACDEQVQEFDFGRGNEAYKYRYGAATRQNLRLIISSPTPRSQLGRTLTRLRIAARRRIK
ncbi:MAG: GNAT family N-acetyltransferase, partial [Chloroflexota bacterium]|nr:GNAT family N-acetyltransferase [Chloroflexota bacterium]